METIIFETPALYGDHHVVEVRRILLDLPGVKDVYASSAFQVVEVDYDAAAVTPEAIRTVLEQFGYLGDLVTPVETSTPADETESDQIFWRHTEVFENTREVVSFAQKVPFSGRPLWPCPGMGVVKSKSEELING